MATAEPGSESTEETVSSGMAEAGQEAQQAATEGETEASVTEEPVTEPETAMQQPESSERQMKEAESTETAAAAPATEGEAPQVQTQPIEETGQAVSAAEAETSQPAPEPGRVVIQPGNNLWQISRVIYGRGIRYTVIYEANKDQIRDPDLIYPGQIFSTPGTSGEKTIDPSCYEPLGGKDCEHLDEELK
jgi:nucleoid-associated protein YgaU